MHHSRMQRHGDLVTVLPRSKPRAKCSICGRPAIGRGWCSKHYQRWLKNGDPLAVQVDPDRTAQERFWEKVDKNGPVPAGKPELGPCWVWTGGTSSGYGMFAVDGKQAHAHIWSYTWAKGEIPEGWERDHLCRNRACVNPDHLEAVTGRENQRRGESPWGINSRKTHCPKGHPYDAENTYITPSGSRACRICARERTREWWQRTRGKGARPAA